MSKFFIGVDLGQTCDYSTIAVVERAELKGEWDAARWAWRKIVELRVRKLERIPLGTPYPEVSARVVGMTKRPALAGQSHLIVDGTGVGRPVVDLLRRDGPAARMMPVVVVAGTQQSYTDGYYHIPKRDLIVGLQVLFQTGGVRLAQGLPESENLARELLAMQVKVGDSGQEKFGSWRQGSHDDLVFAVALGCWGALEVVPKPRPGDEAWWENKREAEMAEVFRKAFKKDEW